MELGTKEILIALAALIIIAILIDGVRRVRNSRYDRIRMSRRKQPIFDDNDMDDFGSELPNGGARVIEVRDADDPDERQRAIKEAAEAKKPKLSFARPQPKTQPITETAAVESESTDQTASKQPDSENKVSEKQRTVVAEENAAEKEPEPEQSALELNEPVPVLMDSVEEPQAPVADDKKSKPLFTSHTKQAVVEVSRNSGESGPKEVIVFHLRAGGEPFEGNKLLDALVAQGMRYGAMKIFHRHSESDGSGPVLFSMANSVEPGTFDLNTMDSFSTPGVSFFIALDEVEKPKDTFDIMLDTIGRIMAMVGGELKDETRSAVTRQTVEHYRQRVHDFERRMLAADA